MLDARPLRGSSIYAGMTIRAHGAEPPGLRGPGRTSSASSDHDDRANRTSPAAFSAAHSWLRARRRHDDPARWVSRLGACAQEAGQFDIRPGLSETQSAARTLAAPSFNPRRRSRSRAAFPDTDAQTWKDVERTHSKTIVVVSVVRVVPVAVGATHVVGVVVERAAAQHARFIGRALHDEPCGSDMTFSAVLSHPPSKRPISATMLDAWRYCAGVIHCQRWHKRR